jgi:F0F1-type ATP synthase membrane subunit b/b'
VFDTYRKQLQAAGIIDEARREAAGIVDAARKEARKVTDAAERVKVAILVDTRDQNAAEKANSRRRVKSAPVSPMS